MQQDSSRLESNRFIRSTGSFLLFSTLAFTSHSYPPYKDVCHLTSAENEMMTHLLDYWKRRGVTRLLIQEFFEAKKNVIFL